MEEHGEGEREYNGWERHTRKLYPVTLAASKDGVGGISVSRQNPWAGLVAGKGAGLQRCRLEAGRVDGRRRSKEGGMKRVPGGREGEGDTRE